MAKHVANVVKTAIWPSQVDLQNPIFFSYLQSDPARIRTWDLWIRNPSLYPTELRDLSGESSITAVGRNQQVQVRRVTGGMFNNGGLATFRMKIYLYTY